MNILLWTLHIMVCLVLIGVVLLQRGKGADMGAALGGGSSNTVFGSRGAGNFLTKITTASAIVFMATSLSLSYLSAQDSSVFTGLAEEAPVAPAAAEGGLTGSSTTTSEGDSSLLQEIPAEGGGSVLQEIPTELEDAARDLEAEVEAGATAVEAEAEAAANAVEGALGSGDDPGDSGTN